MLALPDKMLIRQKSKMIEVIGGSSSNSYQILSNDQTLLVSADEVPLPYWEGKTIIRQTSDGWTKHPINYRDQNHSSIMRATHPIRWFLDRVELHTPEGKLIGIIQDQFQLFRRAFYIQSEKDKINIEVSTGFFNPYNYRYRKNGNDIAYLKKEWKGLFREAFTSQDSFELTIVSHQLDPVEKLLILASGIYIDLKYFNKPPVQVRMSSP